MAELNLVFDTDPAQVNSKGIAQPNTAPEEEVDAPVEAGDDAAQSGDAGGDTDEPAPAKPAAKPAKSSKPTPAKKAA